MDGRMTVCNMSIEAGARCGMIAPDEVTFEFLKGRKYTPENYEDSCAEWLSLSTDEGALFDKEINIDGKDIEPFVTWGTSPQDVSTVTGIVPDPEKEKNEDRKIPIKQMLRDEALKAFEIWDKKTDKIEY